MKCLKKISNFGFTICTINVVLMLFTFLFSSFQLEKHRIYWSSTTLLSWDDFKGRPPAKSVNGAISNISVSLEYKSKSDTLVLFIPCFFTKTKSWSLTAYRSDEALLHERVHFNIAEIFARKMRKEILKTKLKLRTHEKFLMKLFKRYNSELSIFQSLYDVETDFHRNKEGQTKWNLKIAKELKELEEFSNPTLKIVFD